MTHAAGSPLVSVVVTNHDYATYLGAAIDSALGQTYRPLEVVVVDDGSTDDSRQVILSYGPRIHPVLKENGGQASALNAGFAASRGALVLFLDADDMLEPDAAASLASAWGEGVARVQGLVSLMDASGQPAGGRLPNDPLPRGDIRSLVLSTGGYPGTGTTGAAFSRDCLARLMPIPEAEWRRAPDTYLRLLAPFVGRVSAVDRPLGRVRIHGANHWSMERVTSQRLREHLEMDRRKERLLHERAGDLGTSPPADWLLRSATHLQSRVALLRMEPAAHPFPGDRPFRLAALGVAASLRNRSFTPRKRIALTGWFLLASLLPRRLAGRVIQAGFTRSDRPLWLQRFLKPRPSRQSRPAVAP